MKMTNNLYQALQQCMALARSGIPLEECLAHYPEHMDELRPLLMAATAPAEQLSSGMTLASRSRIRQQVMEHWDRTHAARRSWAFPRIIPAIPARWAAAAAVVAFLLLGGGVGTVAAAQDAVPGSSLYAVKQLREDTALWFARSPEEKVAVYSSYIQERVREIATLDQSGKSEPAATSLSRLEGHLMEVDRIINVAPLDTSLAQSGRSGIIEALEEDLSNSALTSNVQDVLDQGPERAYPCLQHTLQVIQQAREQVSSALEKVGGSLPSDSSRVAAGTNAFCPP